MADNAALANAMTLLANAINTFAAAAAAGGGAGGGAGAAPVHVAVTDLYNNNDPFDLSTRTGANAFNDISKPLAEKWDGTVENFPMFVIALQERARKGNWLAADPYGIVEINGLNLLTDYHRITNTNITDARTARTNARARQNAQAMYECIKDSITGDIRANLFSQSITNLPTLNDGPALFISLTKFTSISSTQLSLIAFNNILSFDPSDFEFNIVTINTRLNHLFVIATTSTRTLDPSERISHTLGIYEKIKQPIQWSQWIQTQIDSFDAGNITNCQDFMNTAVIKQTTIKQRLGDFNGSLATVHEEIVSMVATLKKKTAKPTKEAVSSDNKSNKTTPTVNKPSWTRHYKDKNGKLYKVGDSKTVDKKTWYFCDCPRHRDKIKWHTFPADECRTRAKWIADGSPSPFTKAKPEAMIGDGDETESTAASTITDESDITSLLASALNLVGDNDVVKDLIADALNSVMEE